jgi:hypothetical protein
MNKVTLPELFFVAQYALAAFDRVPSWHCFPTLVAVVFLYLYEEGKKVKAQSAEDARRLSRRAPAPPVTLHHRHTRVPHDH